MATVTHYFIVHNSCVGTYARVAMQHVRFPLLSALQNPPIPSKGITIILIAAHRFINRRFAAASDADGVLTPLIATATAHTYAYAVDIGHFLGQHRTRRIRAIKFEPASG